MSNFQHRNPFVGPRPIQRDEALFGRDTEVGDLSDWLEARRIVVLHSPSGAGKSSLVQAGLIPRLLAGGDFDVWRPIRVNLDPSGLGIPVERPFNRYLLSALMSLEEELPETERRKATDLGGIDFLDYLESRRPRAAKTDRNLVLIFDQFEEILTVAPQAVAEKKNFFSSIGKALDRRRDVWALFVIREDYLAALAPYRDRIPTQMANTFRLDLLSRESAAKAAEQLAETGGRKFPAAAMLGRELSMVQAQQPDGSFVAQEGSYVEPVQLQVVCRRLWQKMSANDDSIELDDVREHADVVRALLDYYEEAVHEIAGTDAIVERDVREWVGSKLIASGIRAQVRREVGNSAGLDNGLIRKLEDHYLVRMEQRAGASWYELSHDRLVAPVQEGNKAWEQEKLQPFQVQAKLWEDSKRADGLLLSAESVKKANEWTEKHKPLVKKEEQEFLDRSQAKLKDRALRARVLWVAAMVLGVLLVVTLVALEQVSRAKDEATKKSEETYATLLIATAQTVKEDATTAATLLREPGHQESALWHQAAMGALQSKIAEVVLRGHAGSVTSVAYSLDGKKIVTGSWDHTARIWNANGSSSPLVFKGHNGFVTSVAFSPDGKKIVTGSGDHTARIWNADGSGLPIMLWGHKSVVDSVAFSPDGKKIVTGSGDNTARIWNADGSGSPVVLKGHESNVTSVAFSPDGQRIVTGSWDHTARIWNADGSGSPVVLKGHESNVTSVAFSPNGKKIVTGSMDKTTCIWNADDSGAPVVRKEHEDSVTSVAFSPDGKRIATVSDKTVRIWNADGSGSPFVLGRHESFVYSAAFSPDGKKIVTGSRDQVARIWNAGGSGSPFVLDRHEESVNSVAYSLDGKKIVTGSWDHTARIWNADGSGAPVVLKERHSLVNSVAFSPDGKKIVTSGADNTARIWNADGSGTAVLLEGHTGVVNSVAFSPDGNKIATGSWDQTARIWNVNGSGTAVLLKGHTSFVNSVAFSPDGNKIVTGGADNTARIWNADGSGTAVLLKGHTGSVTSVAFSSDGKKILTGSDDQTARVWNADGSGTVDMITGHDDIVNSVAFSPDGKKIVTGSRDQTARVWNADGSGAPFVFKGHSASVNSVAFSPDGKKVVTGSRDQTARIWILPSDLLLEALWAATSDCLPEYRRQELLAESAVEAKLRHLRCLQDVARRRGWPAPAAL